MKKMAANYTCCDALGDAQLVAGHHPACPDMNVEAIVARAHDDDVPALAFNDIMWLLGALEEAQAEVERLRAELDDSADVQAARAGARARAALLADRLVCP